MFQPPILCRPHPAPGLVTEINTYVEVVMVPVRFMILAPLPGSVHLGNVVANLAALLPVARNVAVDSRSICFKPPMAIITPLICASGAAK